MLPAIQAPDVPCMRGAEVDAAGESPWVIASSRNAINEGALRDWVASRTAPLSARLCTVAGPRRSHPWCATPNHRRGSESSSCSWYVDHPILSARTSAATPTHRHRERLLDDEQSNLYGYKGRRGAGPNPVAVPISIRAGARLN